MVAGRPTKYTPESLELAKDYLNRWQELGDAVPCQEGLADHMGIGLTTIKTWAADEDKEEFRAIFESVKIKQGRRLINSGLNGDFNSVITKLMLGKHDYSDKVDNKLSGDADAPIKVEHSTKFNDQEIIDRYLKGQDKGN